MKPPAHIFHLYQQAYKLAPWRVQLQMIGVFSMMVVLVALIAGVYLNVTARGATIGREIQQMEAEILRLQRDNADLETQLALLTSIATMERRARDLGFQPVDPEKVVYIQVAGYAGKQTVILAPPPEPVAAYNTTLPPEFTQTLFDWLLESAIPTVGTRSLDLFSNLMPHPETNNRGSP